MEKFKILLVTDEVWNDQVHGNNVLSNWFDGFNAEFANIYCCPGIPNNSCCKRYFQLTDMMMLKSIFLNVKAGNMFELHGSKSMLDNSLYDYPEPERKKLYERLKSIASESLRAIRDWIWLTGKYDEKKLNEFISDFDPDIVFCPRFATRKMLRLERTIAKLSGKPMVAFTGDDEYSLQQLNFSPIYWVRKFLLRRDIRNTLPIYRRYYTLSSEQKVEFQKEFPNLTVELLRKCADFNSIEISTDLHKPIKIIYAGRLYCNRWKTLMAIAKALCKINSNGPKMVMEIYTYDKLNNTQKNVLNDQKNSFLMKPVTADKLKEIYKSADIALHVESLDMKNRLLTRLSFSTKIIDCLASGCAVIAVCWDKHSGYTYLKQENAAICISKYEDIIHKLQEICERQEIIVQYKKNAQKCGKKNHQRELVQKKLLNDFMQIAKMG